MRDYIIILKIISPSHYFITRHIIYNYLLFPRTFISSSLLPSSSRWCIRVKHTLRMRLLLESHPTIFLPRFLVQPNQPDQRHASMIHSTAQLLVLSPLLIFHLPPPILKMKIQVIMMTPLLFFFNQQQDHFEVTILHQHQLLTPPII